MEKFYSTQEVAQLCSVSRGSVVRWIHENKLPAAITAGGHHRICASSLRHFLEELRMPVPQELFSASPVPLRILIVDDDPQVQKFLQLSLQQILPHSELDRASDGFEAGIKVQKMRPAVVLLDLKLPGVDGYKVLEQIRQNNELKDTRVIMISGFHGPEIHKQLETLGADDFLSKPFTVEQLKTSIQTALNGSGRRYA